MISCPGVPTVAGAADLGSEESPGEYLAVVIHHLRLGEADELPGVGGVHAVAVDTDLLPVHHHQPLPVLARSEPLLNLPTVSHAACQEKSQQLSFNSMKKVFVVLLLSRPSCAGCKK